MGFYFNINQILLNIKKYINNYQRIFYVNDTHYKRDKEFDYLYPHGIDTQILSHLLDDLTNQELYVLNKDTLSPFHNEHILKLCQRLKIQEFTLCGGTSDDILATCYNLIDLKKEIKVLNDCIGDITESRLDRMTQILKEINIIN